MPLATSLIDDLVVSVRDGVPSDEGIEASIVEFRENDSVLKMLGRPSSHTSAFELTLESSSSVGGVRGVGSD
jgi:hypothetical protein